MIDNIERRNYFRINDIIGLSYTALTDDDVQQPKQRPDTRGDMCMPLADLLRPIDTSLNQMANSLWNENPAAAKALGLLNRKISLLAAHIMQSNGPLAESYEDMMVSLSGSGMGFHATEALPTGTSLLVNVILKPSQVELSFTATVVGCEALPEHSEQAYWMRISIDEGNNDAREQLIQHVVQKQASALALRNS